MTNQNINESLSDFYADMFSAFQTLGKIDIEAWENAARTQNDMFTLWAAFSKKQYDILTYIKEPQDLAEAEHELSNEFVTLSMELAQRSLNEMSQTMTDTFEQLVNSAEKGLSAADLTDALATTTKKPAKRKPAAPRKPRKASAPKKPGE